MPRISNIGGISEDKYNPNEFVTNSGFGLDLSNSPHPKAIKDTLEKFDTNDSILAEIYLREAYDMQYDIHDHTVSSNKSNFRLVTLYPKENQETVTMLSVYIERYLGTNVKEYFGLDFNQFLNLPFNVGELILKSSEEFSERNHTKLENDQNELDRLKEQLTKNTPKK